MATETNLTKVNVFPSEQSYETNKSSLGTGELSLVKMANSFFSGVKDYSFGQSGSSGGYIKHANGLMVQWGKQRFEGNNTTCSITFEQPFSSAVYSVVATPQRTKGSGGGGTYTFHIMNADVTTTGFSVYSQIENGPGSQYLNWIALGDWE